MLMPSETNHQGKFVEKMELLPCSPDLRVIVSFSPVTAWSTLAGFKRLNREIYTLLHSKSPFNLKKRKRDSNVCGINALRGWRARWDLNPALTGDATHALAEK
jgi:hypothetical protein